MFGQEQRRVATKVPAQHRLYLDQVVGMDLVAGVGLRVDADLRRLSAAIVPLHAVQGVVVQVVVPELFARCPQRQFEAFLAFADLREVAVLAPAALTPAPAQHQQQRDRGQRRPSHHQRLAPQWRLHRDRNAQFVAGPHAVAVAGLGAERVVAGRQLRVGDVLRAAVINPAGFKALQAVAVAQVRGRGKVERPDPQAQDRCAVRHLQRRGLRQDVHVAGGLGAYAR